MEENQIMDPEWEVDISDLVSDEVPEETAEGMEQEEVQETEPLEEAHEEPAGQQDGQQEEPEGKPAEEEFYELNVLGESKRVSRKAEEVVPWIQKGMDYDRVHSQNDNLRSEVTRLTEETAKSQGVMKHLEAIAAKTNGGDVDALIKNLRIGMVARERGLDTHNADQYKMAQRIVENQDVEASLAANKQKQTEERTAAEQKAQLEERQNREIREFGEKHPDIFKAVNEGREKLAPEIWEDVRSGISLNRAYERWAENAALKKQIEELTAKAAADKQNETNRQRSVGSANTSGQSRVTDKFLQGFESAW